MYRKQVFIPAHLATRIESEAKATGTSESAVLRAAVVRGLEASAMTPATAPAALENIRVMDQLQRIMTVTTFLLKNMLLIRNYAGSTLQEVYGDDSVADEFQRLQSVAEETHAQLMEEIEK